MMAAQHQDEVVGARLLRQSEGRVPPHDLNAEAAVLSAIMLDGERMRDVADVLRPDHFFAEAHRQIFAVQLELHVEGQPVDIVHVGERLKLRERIKQVGGSSYLIEILNTAPFVANARAYADIVIGKARVRQTIAAAQRIAAVGYTDYGDADAYCQEAAQSLERIAATGPARGDAGFPFDDVIGSAALAEPLGPVPWLVPGLYLAPGAPTMIAGYGYSRKTLAMQDLALAVASGGDVWGTYHATRGRVVHLDYEQGRRLTQDRYQRLARARGIDLPALGDALRLVVFPPLYLDTPNSADAKRAEDIMCRACDGAQLLILDSFRASCPSIEENSSEARRPLDMLGRVSNRTGATVIVVHHARKPADDSPAARAAYTIRGSSAIFDACANIFVFNGMKGEPTKVHHEKERITGMTIEDIGLDATDVQSDTNPRWGLHVRTLDAAQLGGPQKKAADRLADAERKVLDVLQGNPGVSKRTVRELVDGVRGTTVDVALERLERAGRVRNMGDAKGGAKYFAAS